jgi:hypothetical protein
MGVRIQTAESGNGTLQSGSRQGLLDGQTHPLSAFNPLNSTRLNGFWTDVRADRAVAPIDCLWIHRQNPARKLTSSPECLTSTTVSSECWMPVAVCCERRTTHGLQVWPLSGTSEGLARKAGPSFLFRRDVYRRPTRWLEKPSKTSGHLFRSAVKPPMLEARCPARRHGWLRTFAHLRRSSHASSS